MACLTIAGNVIKVKEITENRRLLEDEDLTIDNTLRSTINGTPKKEFEVTTPVLKQEDAYDIVSLIDGTNGASLMIVYDQYVTPFKAKVKINNIERVYAGGSNSSKIITLSIREV